MKVDMKRNHVMPAVAIIVGVSVAAVEFYSVRELIAALLMFSILFGIVGAGFLILIAAEELALKGMTLLEHQNEEARTHNAEKNAEHQQGGDKFPYGIEFNCGYGYANDNRYGGHYVISFHVNFHFHLTLIYNFL